MYLNPTSVKLEYDERENELYAGSTHFEHSFRTLSEMKPVLLDERFVTDDNSTQVLYTIFRNAVIPEHREIFEEHKIRYDVTVLEPFQLGTESCKTMGHYHPVSDDGINSYPELYEVIEGDATFLLQKESGNRITEAKLIDAVKGDKVLIPPGCGHISINRGNSKLILADLVSSVFKSEYEKIKELHGGAVYVIKQGSIIQNPHYYKVRVNRLEAPDISWIDCSSSIYDQFVENPDLFGFLNSPSLLPH